MRVMCSAHLHVDHVIMWLIYNFIDLLRDVLAGYNGTIFAYGLFKQDLISLASTYDLSGQTGAGKTFTMFGPDKIETADDRGIVPRTSAYVPSPLPLSSPRLSSPIFSCFLAIPSLFQGEGREMPRSPTKEFQAHIRAHRLRW